MFRTLAATLLLALLCSAVAEAAATRVVLFTVSDPVTGKLRPGYAVASRISGACWEGSMSADRPDAWRCMAGNNIYDPCYAAATNVKLVYCAESGNAKKLVAMTLTKALPLNLANHASGTVSGNPGTIVLAGGVTCTMITGATGVVAGMRINYGCSDKRMLVGDVNKSSSQWRIYAMPGGGSGETTLVPIVSAIY